MAHVYVDSNAVGTGTGANWANAYTTLAAALTAKAAGDNFWVAHNHAETQASAMALSSKGTAAAPCTVICVNSAGTVPPVSADIRATASITTTGNNAMTVYTASATYWDGLNFNCGTGAVAAKITLSQGGGIQRYKNCAFSKLGTSAATSAIQLDDANSNYRATIVWDNCSVTFGNTGDRIDIYTANLQWRNTTSPIVGATIPTTLFGMVFGGSIFCEGVDFSALSTNVMVAAGSAACPCYFKDCKLPASAVMTGTLTNPSGPEVFVIRSDSSGTNYRHEKYQYMGSQVVETTIVRTGGATDGTTPLAWKIVTGANSKWILPFECLPIALWNDSTASLTVTLYGIWGGGAVPTNANIWMEVSYLGASGSPIDSLATAGTADYLAAGANLTADGSTWGGSTTAFSMSATFTPAQKGPITIIVKAALASSTFYIDPQPAISGVTVSKSLILSPGVYANELSGGGGGARARLPSGLSGMG